MVALIIYTDGSCLGNKNGGWAFLLLNYKGRRWLVSGGEKNTTNNRMELNALIYALLFVSKANVKSIEIRADSMYVINGCTTWFLSDLSRGWKERKKAKLNGKPNADLWKKVFRLMRRKKIKFTWIRGHSGEKGNEIVDKACRKEAEEVE